MQDHVSSLGSGRPAPSPEPGAQGRSLVTTVVVDWDALVAERELEGPAVAQRLSDLLHLGVDVVLSREEPVDDLLLELEASPDEPGRLSVSQDGLGDAQGSDPEATLVVGGQPLLAALDGVLAAHAAFPVPVDDPSWLLAVEGFDPERAQHLESWFTVANGRTGTRGSLEEPRSDSSPAVYVAGVYGRAGDGSTGPELAPGPDWPHLRPRLGDEVADLDAGAMLEHRRVLDLRQGILFRQWRQQLPSGRDWSFRSARWASLADRNIMAIEVQMDPEATPVAVDAIPVPTEHRAIESVETSAVEGAAVVSLRARQGGGARFTISTHEEAGHLRRLVSVERHLHTDATVPPAEGTVAVPRDAAGMAGLRARHRLAWRDRWRDADVVVEGDDVSQRALRFSLYHLISAGDPESDAASIGARGLTGPGYKGHVFWDTEIFILPFFIWTHPPTAKALLAYRYRTLPAARAKAEASGWSGALYPWESADTGDETTPSSITLSTGQTIPVLNASQEHHISADVAWATWEYWRVTGDDAFLVEMGAEIILETARFWASRAEGDGGGRFHIKKVIGPDEYHDGVDDSAYTNVMAAWNIRVALEVWDVLAGADESVAGELFDRIELDASERERWRAVADGLVTQFDPETLLYEQFTGFSSLEDVIAADLAPRPFGGEVLLGVEYLQKSQVVKQADVVMLAHLLPETVPPEVAAANYRHYEPRTAHGSSLSPAIHAAVAARVGLLDDAVSYFGLAAGIDLDDRMGNAADGVHVATMGGLWQAAVLGFGGVRGEHDQVRIDPRPHPSWAGLSFPLQWRGVRIHVKVRPNALELRLDGPVVVAVGTGPGIGLEPGTYRSRRVDDSWSALEATEDQ